MQGERWSASSHWQRKRSDTAVTRTRISWRCRLHLCSVSAPVRNGCRVRTVVRQASPQHREAALATIRAGKSQGVTLSLLTRYFQSPLLEDPQNKRQESDRTAVFQLKQNPPQHAEVQVWCDTVNSVYICPTLKEAPSRYTQPDASATIRQRQARKSQTLKA